ncbi:hypothetical protein SLA2020_023900 [Shorea laevis]
MSKIATIIGSVAGAVAFVTLVIGFLWFCKSQSKNLSNRNFETGSSDPSALVEWEREAGQSSSYGQALFALHCLQQFTMEELEQATRKFDEINLIGYGSFSQVYKGLLHYTTVAIKRQPGAQVQHQNLFLRKKVTCLCDKQVAYLSKIQHPNKVSLLGYCQDSGSQIAYEYLPIGCMCNHLYKFKQRLTIALGPAKGLCHLHSLKPPLAHRNFKTANVLVDENFNAKVADAGMLRTLEKIEEDPSCTSTVDVLQDLE